MDTAIDLAAALENIGSDVCSVAELRYLSDAAATLRRQHEALTWIDREYENINLDHRHFRVGAKLKASEALEGYDPTKAPSDAG